jgi:hypothetical protein
LHEEKRFRTWNWNRLNLRLWLVHEQNQAIILLESLLVALPFARAQKDGLKHQKQSYQEMNCN